MSLLVPHKTQAGWHRCTVPARVGYWTRFALSDLPNDLISADDLERFGITLDEDQAPAIS